MHENSLTPWTLPILVSAVRKGSAWNEGPHWSVAWSSHSRFIPAVASGALLGGGARLPQVR